MSLACMVEEREFNDLLAAPIMRKYSFSYDTVTGQLEFHGVVIKHELAKDLASVIDAGETSWSEVLH